MGGQLENKVNEKFSKGLVITGILLTLGLSSGCATKIEKKFDPFRDDSYEEYSEATVNYDPLERFNRAMFKFNQPIFEFLDIPSKAYSETMPDDLEALPSNFYSNLKEPFRAFCFALKGEFKTSIKTAWRFIINSTAGIYGLADAAEKEFDIPKKECAFEDIGYAWTNNKEPYFLNLPFIGPTTTWGFPDKLNPLDPANYFTGGLGLASTGIRSIYEINGTRSNREFFDATFDPYLAMRNAVYDHKPGGDQSEEVHIAESK